MRVLLLAALLACGGADAPAPVAPTQAPVAVTPGQVDVATLAARKAAGEVGLVVDVRTPGEYAGGHVPGAVNIPMDQVGSRLGEFEGKGDVYVICEVGGRSARVAADLGQRGVKVTDVAGGTSAWKAAGHPVE